MYASEPEESLVPIFEADLYRDSVTQIGTGIFVEYESQPFLLTAAHVTDSLKYTKLLVPAFDSIYPIDGYVGCVDLLPGETRLGDKIDISYYRLDSRFAKGMLENFKPWPQKRMSMARDASRSAAFSVYGYPASRAKLRSQIYTSEAASFRGFLGTPQDYAQENIFQEQSIIVRFHKRRAIDMESKTRKNPIHPKGMSGGAIFEWPVGERLSTDWSIPNLVGVFHTYKEASGLLIGTPLYVVMTSIMLGQMKNFGGVR